jgi:hypothetical protein
MIDKGLYKNGRKGFFKGAQADTRQGKSMSPGTSASGGSRNVGGGGGGNNNNRGGGADLSKVETLPPVRTTLPSNVRIIDTIMTPPTIGGAISTNPMDLKEQYRIGNVPFDSSSIYTNKPYAVSIADPYMTKALETQRYNNFVDARNLEGATLPKPNTGILTLDTVLNVATPFRNFMFNKNKNFFAENVAGKYGYGYGLEDYKNYMKDRMAGNVNAYGRTLTNAEKGGRDDDGIMQVSQVNPLLPEDLPREQREEDDENEYDFNYGTASNPIYYKDLI